MLEAVSRIILYLPFLLFMIGLGFYIAAILRHYRQGKLSELKPSKVQFYDFATGQGFQSIARINCLLLFEQNPSGICPGRPKNVPKFAAHTD